ncbi:MYXO-CTERM sorting domain-containing protein [Halapricum desulfuricans]|uniref:Uncharacterized protein n=1 Tax=Halapricum desulfuricans TaxID=2841257 RepID=A0A897N547_9EURY|nr:MYXO-CTERM sorting domain-containing protein [Halapricum desulfuricans]QSG09520.1 hypothetical protein HSR122_2136 [Halapricum desulfuricans]QSG11415.1 hypothetical protein HSBGL_0988 [Halapricum desulfuricans]
MAEFTFLEIHLDDASIEGSADGIVSLPFSSVTSAQSDDESEPDGGSSRSVWALALLALVLVVIAVLRKRRE